MQPLDINIGSPVECTIVRRLNRFVVEIEVDGTPRQACINNTGRLDGFLEKGKTGFCIRNGPLLRTAYRLFAIGEGDRGAIIDTRLQTKAFEKALADGLIPWLDGRSVIRRNVRLGGSLIDYLLQHGEEHIYLEVKSAVLRDGQYAMYPDCPTARGRRHIVELMGHRTGGGVATVLFIAAVPGVAAFKPSRAGDPDLCDLLAGASRAGVDLRAVAMHYEPGDFSICLDHPDLPVEL